jgi:hypothetical protein
VQLGIEIDGGSFLKSFTHPRKMKLKRFIVKVFSF